VLCPAKLPRASVGTRSLRRLRVTVYSSETCGFAGLAFMYFGEPPGHGPRGFLHFELDPRSRCYYADPGWRPSDSRAAWLGGRVGWLEPADGKSGYFGDHVRFYFRVGKVGWVASLHSFGSATTPLLGRLMTGVRVVTPAGRIRNPSG
jgi:hypothetical protein